MSKKLEVILTTILGISLFGSALGFESNLKPFSDRRIEDTSFESYIDSAKREYNGLAAYALAVVTYPGARIAAEIHNSKIK